MSLGRGGPRTSPLARILLSPERGGAVCGRGPRLSRPLSLSPERQGDASACGLASSVASFKFQSATETPAAAA